MPYFFLLPLFHAFFLPQVFINKIILQVRLKNRFKRENCFLLEFSPCQYTTQTCMNLWLWTGRELYVTAVTCNTAQFWKWRSCLGFIYYTVQLWACCSNSPHLVFLTHKMIQSVTRGLNEAESVFLIICVFTYLIESHKCRGAITSYPQLPRLIYEFL